jgi:anti-sigma factor RsiW
MNAVQIAGYWVPARDTLREHLREPVRGRVPDHLREAARHPVRRPETVPLTTLLRRRAAWGLAVARGRGARSRH